jgi:hypothetical protein
MATSPKLSRHLIKLATILNDEATYGEVVRWTQEGTAFKVFKKDVFANEILPLFYGHGNYNSFLRQLNIYGFKTVRVDKGFSLHEYHHPLFTKAKPQDMFLIHRVINRSCVKVAELALGGNKEARREGPSRAAKRQTLERAKAKTKAEEEEEEDADADAPKQWFNYHYDLCLNYNVPLLHRIAFTDSEEQYAFDLNEDFSFCTDVYV